MKTIIALLTASLLLTSCSSPTQSEIDEKKKLCVLDGRDVQFVIGPFGGSIECKWKTTETPVMDCIKEYTDGIDEKYNNPDTVENLREDAFSNVVKTCNEVFGKTLSGSGNQ